MSAHPLTYVDVFTNRPLAGNQLAVVHDADDIDETTMLAFAAETKFSETTFLQSSRAAEADYRNRIWDPHEELPFAGHPSLGTAVAVAARRNEETASYVQETGAGCQPVDVERTGQRLWRASMLQEPARLGAEADAVRVLAALGLEAEDGHAALPPQFVATGIPQLVVPLASPRAVSRARPDYEAIAGVLAEGGAVTAYAVHVEGDRVHARAFTGSVSMGEDPATGSAAGPLCAYLAARSGTRAVTIEQGVEMGRPSRLLAELAGDRVRVSGEVVVLSAGTLWL